MNLTMNALIDFLRKHSPICQALDEPVTIEELLVGRPSTDAMLLARLQTLYVDKMKISNCMLDNTRLYDSLIGCTDDYLAQLEELIDYFGLPDVLTTKIKNARDIKRLGDTYYIPEKDFYSSIYNCCTWSSIGDIRGLKWFYEQTKFIDSFACCYAAGNGHLDCLKWLYEIGTIFEYEGICSNAANGGHIDILEWIHKSTDMPVDETLSPSVCNSAAGGGYLDCLKWLYAHGYSFDEGAVANAARGKHIDCVRWLCAAGAPLSTMATTMAAGASLECLQFLCEIGCPIDSRACVTAVQSGKLDCLKYAHEHGSCLSIEAKRRAEERICKDCLEYLIANNCPQPRLFRMYI